MNPFDSICHAKAHLVEQIMALIGRASPNPVRYRQMLEDRDIETLRRMHEELLDSSFSSFASVEFGFFPAPEETTDDTTHAKRASGASTPARETLTLKSTLP